MMKLKDNFSVQKIADKSIIIDNSAVEYDMTRMLILNESSEWLWNRFKVEEFTQLEVEEALVGEYELDTHTAEIAAQSWISLLKKYQLVDF